MERTIFKVSNNHRRTTLITLFWCLHRYFEHISHLFLVFQLLVLKKKKKLLGYRVQYQNLLFFWQIANLQENLNWTFSNLKIHVHPDIYSRSEIEFLFEKHFLIFRNIHSLFFSILAALQPAAWKFPEITQTFAQTYLPLKHPWPSFLY